MWSHISVTAEKLHLVTDNLRSYKNNDPFPDFDSADQLAKSGDEIHQSQYKGLFYIWIDTCMQQDFMIHNMRWKTYHYAQP